MHCRMRTVTRPPPVPRTEEVLEHPRVGSVTVGSLGTLATSPWRKDRRVPTRGHFREWINPDDRFNYNPDNYIQTPSERRNVFRTDPTTSRIGLHSYSMLSTRTGCRTNCWRRRPCSGVSKLMKPSTRPTSITRLASRFWRLFRHQQSRRRLFNSSRADLRRFLGSSHGASGQP